MSHAYTTTPLSTNPVRDECWCIRALNENTLDQGEAINFTTTHPPLLIVFICVFS